jgi:hypothetical protein
MSLSYEEREEDGKERGAEKEREMRIGKFREFQGASPSNTC